ncbi:MAG: hypothetical protein WBQ95_18505 [Terracidiphilus sp.]
MTVNRSRWIQFVTLAAIWFAVRVYFVAPHGSWMQRAAILGAHLAGALLFSGGVVGAQIWNAHRKSCVSPR